MAVYPYWKTLRVNHWFKNSLIFLPLLADHKLYDPSYLANGIVAFFAFCLCASGIYLLNDLMDISQDRLHPHKKHRMLASGKLPISHAIALIVLFWGCALLLSLTLSIVFLEIFILYSFIMVIYCLQLRNVLVADVVSLMSGYVLRVLAGIVAMGIPISFWLLLFVALFFFGLSWLKRYAELLAPMPVQGVEVYSRAYSDNKHRIPIAYAGFISGLLSILALSIYIDTYQSLYAYSWLLWIMPVLLVYWIPHIWIMASERKIQSDPVHFTLTDRTSQIVAVLFVLITLIVELPV